LKKKKVYKYQKGETIYCEDTRSNHIFLIKSGLVKTYNTNELGKEFNTGYFSINQYFGFISFVKNIPHFDNSKAITATQLYKIDREEINDIIKSNQQVLMSFINLLTGKLMDCKKQCLTLAYGSVREKTAHSLLKLLKIYPLKADNEIFIDRNNLANSIGIAKETLTRTLHQFKEESLIEITKKGIKILDKEALLNVT
jgi:CRP-like cAMP-binding protein